MAGDFAIPLRIVKGFITSVSKRRFPQRQEGMRRSLWQNVLKTQSRDGTHRR
ncbi:hypothetical protein Chls_790 [Chlamydia suis]|uniref:Uncharacterized protein n=1 Tax=Chlamydia suis TaxID=83559 RepID=A0ABX6IRH7_9CHLA|nr:hypothetical protein Chls_790 [Chlamydia suis]